MALCRVEDVRPWREEGVVFREDGGELDRGFTAAEFRSAASRPKKF